jgi:ubiquinol oxidase
VDISLDLKREQQASLARPRYPYAVVARLFFWSMDVFAGRKTTLSKTKLLEMLASIPYRQWEIHQYARLTRRYRDAPWVQQANRIVAWGRKAQDNEYWHLLVIQEKMKADGLKDAWYLTPPIPWLMVWTYVVLARLLALFSLRQAFLFNAQFEDHAEHVYAQFVAEHPEWETQPVNHPLVAEYTDATTWADVFRRIGLDERDHRNRSFVYAGKPEHVVAYPSMPE